MGTLIFEIEIPPTSRNSIIGWCGEGQGLHNNFYLELTLTLLTLKFIHST